MKLPKKVVIAGRDFDIIQTNDNNILGHFNCNTQEIKIRTKGLKRDLVYQALLHEIIEAILTERSCRFTPSFNIGTEGCNFLFSFDHNKFEELISEICYALKNSGLLNIK